MRNASPAFLSGPSACPRASHGVLDVSRRFQSSFKAFSKQFQSSFAPQFRLNTCHFPEENVKPPARKKILGDGPLVQRKWAGSWPRKDAENAKESGPWIRPCSELRVRRSNTDPILFHQRPGVPGTPIRGRRRRSRSRAPRSLLPSGQRGDAPHFTLAGHAMPRPTANAEILALQRLATRPTMRPSGDTSPGTHTHLARPRKIEPPVP
jgi:hypothetical protein